MVGDEDDWDRDIQIVLSSDNFVVLQTEDWEALYLNGKKMVEGHSLSVRDVLTGLGVDDENIEFKYVDLDPYDPDQFPENL